MSMTSWHQLWSIIGDPSSFLLVLSHTSLAPLWFSQDTIRCWLRSIFPSSFSDIPNPPAPSKRVSITFLSLSFIATFSFLWIFFEVCFPDSTFFPLQVDDASAASAWCTDSRVILSSPWMRLLGLSTTHLSKSVAKFCSLEQLCCCSFSWCTVGCAPFWVIMVLFTWCLSWLADLIFTIFPSALSKWVKDPLSLTAIHPISLVIPSPSLMREPTTGWSSLSISLNLLRLCAVWMHESPFEVIIVEKPCFLDVQPAPKFELPKSSSRCDSFTVNCGYATPATTELIASMFLPNPSNIIFCLWALNSLCLVFEPCRKSVLPVSHTKSVERSLDLLPRLILPLILTGHAFPLATDQCFLCLYSSRSKMPASPSTLSLCKCLLWSCRVSSDTSCHSGTSLEWLSSGGGSQSSKTCSFSFSLWCQKSFSCVAFEFSLVCSG